MKARPMPRSTPPDTAVTGSGSCGIPGQIADDRLELMGLLVRTHRRLTDQLGRELEASVGIPLVWFDVLINVGGAPEGRLTMSKLSSDVALTTGGVTRLVDRMEEAGLVVRTSCPNDRRSVHVVLTPDGQDTLHRAITEHIEGIDRHLVGPLTDGDRSQLRRLLTKLSGPRTAC
ncbi:MAG TPA: MarR family transcriptional regulator [Acidimicrobiales bacterium]|nr:MarR family transcriptional regulator [Acidimicrobiales bacterium]